MDPKTRSFSAKSKHRPAVVFTVLKETSAPGPSATPLSGAAFCGIRSTTTRYAGAPRARRSHPAWVEVLRDEPVKPHDQLGEIIVDATADPASTVSKLEDILCKEAAKIGADAAVIVYDGFQPAGISIAGGYWRNSGT